VQPPEPPDANRDQNISCDGPLHPHALEGLRLFNQGHYFEAHEALETAWRAEPAPVRDVYQGVLQVGVAYYQILRANYRGARKMFKRCRQWLDPLPDACLGINLAQLRADFLQVEAEVIRLGPDRIHLFNPNLLKPVLYSSP